ncbi:tetratricopeptide repeat protein [Actinoplanes missouriensis]|uniref:tetratricopeptide repeat protein n=1 Tax=Actinoplanes missouriensis TaxID=1866 RepID=UPI0033FAFDF4
MSSGRLTERALWITVPAAVAGVAAWAAFADDKTGWTIGSASVAASVGAFAPTMVDRVIAAGQRRRAGRRQIADLRSADLPASVTVLLRPHAEVVAFFGRGWELQSLQTWASDPDTVPVRLVVGAGGVGKTRLALELAARLHAWDHLPVRPGAETRTADMLVAGELRGPLLLVVDYAEARDRAALAALLCAVAKNHDQVRVLLLARRAGLWWESLSADYPEQAHVVDALTVPDHVLDLPAEVERDPATIVSEAVTAFAGRLRRAVPANFTPSTTEPGTPLLRLHAEALLIALGGEVRQGRYDVLDEVLRHEARYWRATARRAGLLSDADEVTDATLRQLVGLAALLGPEGGDVTGLVRRAPALRDRPEDRAASYARWLVGLYPPDQPGAAIGTLQPDLLAEALSVQVLRQCGDQILAGLGAEQAERALTVLGRACAHQPDAPELIDAALAADVPRMTEAVVAVGVQFPGRFSPRIAELLATAPIDPAWALTVHRRVPNRSVELRRVALALSARVAEKLDPAVPRDERAVWLTRYANDLWVADRHAEALPVNREVTGIYRELAAEDPDEYLPYLAMALYNMVRPLAAAGRADEALAASSEALELWRRPPHGTSSLGRSLIARQLTNHGAQLAEMGRPDEALAASLESVRLWRDLIADGHDEFRSNLAETLGNHTRRLSNAGRTEEALAVSGETVRLLRQLAEADPDTQLGALLVTLISHAILLSDAGRSPQALPICGEAVQLGRRLAGADPAVYRSRLAFALCVSGKVAVDAGTVTLETIALVEESAGHYRELASRDPALFGRMLDIADGVLRLVRAAT